MCGEAKVIIGGESGGGLVALLALQAASVEQLAIAGGILMSPLYDARNDPTL
jgi:acetyl esterase/lipase